MLQYVYFPIAALETLRPTEAVALLRLMAHADCAGRAWPKQCTLAAGTTMSPAAMQRAVAGLAEAGHIEVAHRFAHSNIYTLAERFRRVSKRPPDLIPAPGCHSPDFDKPEGEAKKEEGSKDLKKEADRHAAAPPLRPARGPNPWARQPWLRRLNRYAGERLQGSQRMLAWEIIAAAETGALPRDQQQALDRIDRQMRACGYGAT